MQVSDELWHERDLRFNDGGCDPDGRFGCGPTPLDHAGNRAPVHRLDPDGTMTRVLDGIGISNGLAWNPDGAAAYYVDTLSRRVDVFDYTRERGLHGRRPFVRIEDGAGYPDGLCVDADGQVWVALWDGAALRCYSTSGALKEIVSLPVRQGTARPHLRRSGARRALRDDQARAVRAGPGDHGRRAVPGDPGGTGLPVAPYGG